MFNYDPNKFKNGTLDTRCYKHPKYCYYARDPDRIYKVIGYFYITQEYKIQSTFDKKIIMVNCFDIAGITDRFLLERLKKQHG